MTDAIAVLTEAARLTLAVLEQDTTGADAAGRAVWVESGRRQPGDWAEFVTAALAGAAANVGGIEAVLAGRPGSWEADAVRDLLAGTVGHDEEHLHEHRTEPVLVQVYVDEILSDLGVWLAYDDTVAQLEPATPEQEREQDRQSDAIADLEDRLEALREQDWADYGHALRTGIEAAATRRGLTVPVQVHVDLNTYRGDRPDPVWDLAEQLLDEAIEAAAVPGQGRPPLDRLTDSSTADQIPADQTPSEAP